MLRERFNAIVQREYHGIGEAALIVSAFTLCSQILALVRERLLAGTFGADTGLDMYYTAFRIPDLLFIIVASFFSFTILIPFFVKKEQQGHQYAKEFLSSITTLFMGGIVIVCVMAYFLMPKLVPLIAPGFTEQALVTTTTLARILLLSPVLLGLSNVIGTVTQVKKRFFVYAVAPVVYNIGIIVGVLWLYPWLGFPGLAIGVVIGALLHVGIQFPVLRTLDYSPRLQFTIKWSLVGEIMKTSLPRTLTLAFSTISLIVLGALATLIGPGSVAIFDLSKNLYTVPIALIGISFSVAAFPSLVALYESGKVQDFSRQVIVAARHIVFWSLPVMGLFIVLRAQIVRVIFGTGRFGWVDTRLSAAVLAIFVLSVAAHNVMLLILRGYYAASRTTKPLIIVASGTVLTIVSGFLLTSAVQNVPWLNEGLTRILRIPDVPGEAVVMLPLAYTIGIISICIGLWIAFVRDFPPHTKRDGFSITLLHSLLATIMLMVISYGALQLLAPLADLSTFGGVFWQGFLAGIAGMIGCIAVFVYLETPEFMEIITKSREKLKPIMQMPMYPEQEP